MQYIYIHAWTLCAPKWEWTMAAIVRWWNRHTSFHNFFIDNKSKCELNEWMDGWMLHSGVSLDWLGTGMKLSSGLLIHVSVCVWPNWKITTISLMKWDKNYQLIHSMIFVDEIHKSIILVCDVWFHFRCSFDSNISSDLPIELCIQEDAQFVSHRKSRWDIHSRIEYISLAFDLTIKITIFIISIYNNIKWLHMDMDMDTKHYCCKGYIESFQFGNDA